MPHHFTLAVHLHDHRYHGADEWPPSPARVFQALVAGVAQGRTIPEAAARALELLEGLPAPVIAAPAARRGQRVALFVPNNDLDAVEGDPDRVSEVRTKKLVQPHLLESGATFLYAWPLLETCGDELVALASGLYQFGRGVDPGWAIGEVLNDEQLASRLLAYRGTIHYPTAGDGSQELAVPTKSSFVSLVRRFDAALQRLQPSNDGGTNFVQPPKAHFKTVRYDGVPPFHLFELRRELEPAKSAPWSASRATSLIEHVRTMAVSALSAALPTRKADIERVLIGRKDNGTNVAPIGQRVRFIPLPSIGHEHADQSIRRLLVQVPPGPLSEGDVLWALSGRPLFDPTTGELVDTTLTAAAADEMVKRYSVSSRNWRSVTPISLGSASRRRVEPKRQREEAKSAVERGMEEKTARHAITQCLRHAEVLASIVRVHVQREPFDAHGTRAERFAEGTRFSKESLWHVELELDREIRGPLALGDGRFLGLGVMAPHTERSALALNVEGGVSSDVETGALARALRRAVMARAQMVLGIRGEAELPSYFHGHERDGKPLQTEHSSHLAYSVDIPGSRLLIVPPHLLDGCERPPRSHLTHFETLHRALDGLTVLRAGRAGVLKVHVSPLPPDDWLCDSARVYRSVSDYAVSRHSKHSSAEEMVIMDVRRECERRKLPRPAAVRVRDIRSQRGVGVLAQVEIVFPVAVRGPLLLGKTRYLGGGLFEPADLPPRLRQGES